MIQIREWVAKYPGDPEALQDALVEEIERLEKAMWKSCRLLQEREHGNPARSPGHNARLCLETALVAYRKEPTAGTA